jgi:hypothetical protein
VRDDLFVAEQDGLAIAELLSIRLGPDDLPGIPFVIPQPDASDLQLRIAAQDPGDSWRVADRRSGGARGWRGTHCLRKAEEDRGWTARIRVPAVSEEHEVAVSGSGAADDVNGQGLSVTHVQPRGREPRIHPRVA